ncbi:ABC transporter permease subunit [Pseudofrankia asymbiotica]|uniref:Branched-chain amino acid ABC transporter permease/ATP-binding protein n=1 Tax=Pseudofrankia asymbiotica TaxID=1834516 RepID=A0A1V2IH11_9ACTN|nr:ATP-binding cassette domain-containing protein [Pseudofrankia asymbiotica]ONH31721.1 branched-chain amino acid ABC transporter permease/ATP-binding protein [Pseudofrankia asymbiotica]
MEFLPYIISGLVTGSVYGLASTGLVLTYKTSGVFNFAHGALATVSAFLFYTLHVSLNLPWELASVICLFGAGPILGFALERLARALSGTGLATRVAATVGMILIVQAGITLIYGSTYDKSLPHFLPRQSFKIDGTPVTAEDLIIIGVALAVTVGLMVFFRLARLGVAMRGVVDNPDLLDVSGTNPVRVRRWAWVIGTTFASASGLLIGPLLTPLDPTALTFLVITAFGAAAIGGFTNLPLAYAGGLAIGLGQAICTKYFIQGFWTGLAQALPFLVLFAVLLVAPRRRLAERSRLIPRRRPSWTTPAPVQIAGGVVGIAVLACVPGFAGIHLTDWTNALAVVVVFLSLGLLVRTSGQVSLCHVSFMAIGLCAMSEFASGHHIPWLVSLFLAGLIAVPIGALLAIPAIRLSGLYLALATFGFGLLLQYMFYSQSYMFGAFGQPVTVPRPSLSWLSVDTDKGFYYLVLAITVLVTVLIAVVNRSRLGRLLRGMADSPTTLSTSGAAVNVTRVLVFCLSAFLAAVAGGLLGAAQPTDATTFQPMSSLTYFALIIIAVGGEPWYAVIAGLGLTLIPSYLTNNQTSNWLMLVFGIGAVLYAMSPDQVGGVPRALQRLLDRVSWRAPRAEEVHRTPAAAREIAPAGGSLTVERLRVRFGGVVAVDGVSLSAPTGRITGLIGPNGAGKTTTFNACSGLNRPSAGKVSLDGDDVSRVSPSARARRGLGRTFQQMELFESLTVRENVALGIEASLAGANVVRHIVGTRKDSRHVADATQNALDLCDLRPLAGEVVGSLSTGQRRLVDLARCLAGPFHVLLLDEPSSGLDRQETRRFGEILRRIVDQRGVGILLVEHDMALVTEVCDYIYVLDFGRPVLSGPPEEVMSSPVVRAAYLGDSGVEGAIERTADDDAETVVSGR